MPHLRCHGRHCRIFDSHIFEFGTLDMVSPTLFSILSLPATWANEIDALLYEYHLGYLFDMLIPAVTLLLSTVELYSNGSS